MRQIFSSARLETVEGVARLLNEAGIETRISDGRSYKGNRRRTFSYQEGADKGTLAAVWVMKADDLTQARIILRDAGLIDSTRSDSYLPLPSHAGNGSAPKRPMNRRRLLLIGLVIVTAIVTLVRSCGREDRPVRPATDPSHIVPVDLSQV